MMSKIGAFLALLLLAQVATATAMQIQQVGRKPVSFPLTKLTKAKPAGPNVDTCSLCVSFMDSAIDNLLDIILEVGVLGGCAGICALLPNQIEQVVCQLLCDYVGVEEFVQIVNIIDPDPIYVCEFIDLCPYSDNAKAVINDLSVDPQSGEAGTTFVITVNYTVQSTIATGECAIDVQAVDGNDLGGGLLLENQTPGDYTISFSLDTTPSQDEPFFSGNYPFVVGVCEGACGSIHPHSYILAQGNGAFVIN